MTNDSATQFATEQPRTIQPMRIEYDVPEDPMDLLQCDSCQ